MQRARALYQFDGAVASDLPMREGEIVTIINKLPGNLWWEGESDDGHIGTFPYNYVEVLPPEPEFSEFIGKKGISNLDIIQFNGILPDEEPSSAKSVSGHQITCRFLAHVIAGDGEYIAELSHCLLVDLDQCIRSKFPKLLVPDLPVVSAPHELYKCIVHDYFAVGVLSSSHR